MEPLARAQSEGEFGVAAAEVKVEGNERVTSLLDGSDQFANLPSMQQQLALAIGGVVRVAAGFVR